ncbi:sensor histidine kinase [Kutzneria buriramensis]|uniref:Signal transduction histidine kinase n=1 Tax=Kutzneria buriramensis TaxID=1045776 RepID=A0A3E0HAK8_9PSEU|nr:ATP-binding protein [Kutzneria buriramensis]REH41076.1 signal transduction histidine kinase [Kutzneria buriramensis]
MVDGGVTRAHPAPMLLILSFRWLTVGWTALIALLSDQVLEDRVVPAVLMLAIMLGWTAWLTMAAVRRSDQVLAFDLLFAILALFVSGWTGPQGQLLTDHPTFAGAYPMAAVAAWATVRGVRGGVFAGVLLALCLPVGYYLNGVSVFTIGFLDALSLLGGALAYVVLGAAVGLATSQFERVSLRLAEGRAVVAGLRERERLAAHIHDDVLQRLGGIRKLGGDLADRGDVSRAELRALMDDVGRQEASLRRLVLDERQDTPAGQRSLVEAVAEVADGYRQWPVRLADSGHIPVPAEVAAEVAAAVNELLGNVVKHARAEHVWISVLDDGSGITVDVRDDGVGFDYDESALAASGRLGLAVSVRARLERLGGSVTIRSRPGRGTDVRLELRSSGP